MAKKAGGEGLERTNRKRGAGSGETKVRRMRDEEMCGREETGSNASSTCALLQVGRRCLQLHSSRGKDELSVR